MSFLLVALALTTLTSSATVSPDLILRDCSARSKGAGPVPTPDTPDAFEDLQVFDDIATSAQTPAGYVQSYKNQIVTYKDADLYLGHMDLDEYSPSECE